jgi:chromosome segregation ATPase
LADNTQIGIRCDEDTKALWEQLSDSSDVKNRGEFLSQILLLYQAQKLSEGESIIKPAVDAAQSFMSQFLDIIIGVGASLALRDDQHARELDEQKVSFESTRGTLTQRIDYLTQSLDESEARAEGLLSERNTAGKKIEEFTKRIAQLESAIKDKDDIIATSKEKNKVLSDLILKNKEYQDENQKLVGKANMVMHENSEYQIRVKDLEREIRSLQEGFQKDQEFLISKLTLEKDAALVDQKDLFQGKIETIREKMNEQQAKYAESISGYENRVKNLFDQLSVSGVNEHRPE